jgi:hypothetical protein
MPYLAKTILNGNGGLPSCESTSLLLNTSKEHILKLSLHLSAWLSWLLLHHHLVTSSIAHVLEVGCHNADGS